MSGKISFSSVKPHLIAIGIFFAVTIIYFSPIIFGGKSLIQSDIMQATGVSKEIADFRAQYHEEPYWTNSVFAGMPAYQISAYYLASNLEYVQKLCSLFIPHPIRYVFICFIGMYLLLQVLKVDSWVSIIGSLAFGLCSYFLIFIDTGHNSKIAAISWMAPVLAGIILTYRGKLLTGGALTALFFAMELYCNHPQITYYLGFLILFYILSELYKAWKEKHFVPFIKQSVIAGAALVLALGVNITGLWATADFSKYTIRGPSELTINPDGSKKENVSSGLDRNYALDYSYGVSESLSLMIPNIKGGAAEAIGDNKDALSKIDPDMREAVSHMSAYFGDMPISGGPIYVGAIMMFLFVLGLFIVKGSFKWALAITTLVSIWLALGKHDPFGLSDFMLNYFPGYNKFRAVVTILVIALLTISVLGTLAISELLKSKNFLTSTISLPFKNSISGQKVLIISFLLTGGISLLCWLAPGMITNFSPSGEREQLFYAYKQSGQNISDQQINGYLDKVFPSLELARKGIVQADAMRSFIFILLAAILIWLYAKNKLINKNILIASLTILILIDMVTVDRRYLNSDSYQDKKEVKNPFARIGRPNAADLEVMKDKDPDYRVWYTLSRPDQDGITSYFHKSLGGYSGAKLRRYQDLLDFDINLRNMAVINMLNTKYIIFSDDKETVQAFPNANALGNAWFVNNYRLVANPDSEILALNKFNPKTTAIIDKRFENDLAGLNPSNDSTATIKLNAYKTNDLVYESNATTDRLAVFSEIYYADGWNAYIDGKLAPYFRANYVLRAMRVPAGKHRIEYKFEPRIIAIGEKISAASMALLFLLCGGAAFMQWRKKQE